MSKINLIFDFDSTFVKLEALDELAGIALKKNKNKNKALSEIKKTTILGMEGAISFPESLSRRFKLLSANKKHVKELVGLLKNNISDSVQRNKGYFKKNHKNIYIISGGFSEYICPVVAEFGIKRKNVLANRFVFDGRGNIIGFDRRNKLSRDNGKVKQIRGMGLAGSIWVIGDGWTDYKIREAGIAEKFVAFFENVKREKVARKADQIVSNFDEFLELNHPG